MKKKIRMISIDCQISYEQALVPHKKWKQLWVNNGVSIYIYIYIYIYIHIYIFAQVSVYLTKTKQYR